MPTPPCVDADENIFAPCLPVKCQCKECEGSLLFDGMNVQNNGAFLACNECGHGYFVDVSEAEADHIETVKRHREELEVQKNELLSKIRGG